MTHSGLLEYAYLIPLAPLLAFAFILIFRKWAGMQGAWIGILALLYGFVHSFLIAAGIFNGSLHLPSEGLQGHFFESAFLWFSTGHFEFRLGILIDGLSAVMLCVVTLVSLLVQIYSVAYMHNHVRFGRYFAYVNLFTFSMLILVVANNLFQFFIGWELVGLCSYLLIGFDFEREAASYAGRKAFITTKLADLGMYIGLLMVFNYFGTFNIPQLFHNVGSINYPGWVLTAVPILFFIGAMGKSAQVPFHVWLPDAMEGPTPASALIHAATMVAAGVYLVARLFFLFEASPYALEVVAWVGVITAVLAAAMGLVANDIKRVLAFSTVSQLGFMMAALGCGGYVAGMFHLTTHAAFKALLFLCAGSVIHAVHTNDMRKMGGLVTKMPITAFTYLIASLAITGCPLLAGFFSKEEILASALHHNKVIFGLLGFASLLTAFYMFRSWFLTFTGVPRDKERFQHANESSGWMTIPLIILAVPSLFLGGFMAYQGNISKWLHWGSHAGGHQGTALVMSVSLMAFVVGAGLAGWMYHFRPALQDILVNQFKPVHRILSERYRFDELYLWFINSYYHPFSRWLAKRDDDQLDQGVVDGFGRGGTWLSWLSNLFDGSVIDKVLVDGQGAWIGGLGSQLRKLQSGLAQSYLFWMALGLGSMLAWLSSLYK